MKKLLLIIICLNFIGCARNVNYIKSKAKARWEELGYEVQGYEGYQWSIQGGDVYYLLKRKDQPRVLYSGFLNSWFGELQVYGPEVKSGQQLNLTQDK